MRTLAVRPRLIPIEMQRAAFGEHEPSTSLRRRRLKTADMPEPSWPLELAALERYGGGTRTAAHVRKLALVVLLP